MRKLLAIAAATAALCATWTAGPAAAAGFARAAGSPRVAVFYYPWYSTATHDGAWAHWSQRGHTPPLDVASDFLPARGAYSSADPAVLDAQMAEIAGTGAGVVVSSWWGSGSVEAARLPAVVAAARAHGLATGVQIEPYDGRTAASVADDIAQLHAALGIGDFYVYRAADAPAADWAAALGALHASTPGIRVLAHTWLVGWAASARFDGLYTYDVLITDGGSFGRICAQARQVGLLCAPSVGPGFSAVAATGEPRTRARRDGATYDTMWRAALAAHADIVTVTSYNEWHEGSQIEPAAPPVAGSRYASYEGAWGLHGAAASGAYLARTALWVERLAGQQPAQARSGGATTTPRILAAWQAPPIRSFRPGSATSPTR